MPIEPFHILDMVATFILACLIGLSIGAIYNHFLKQKKMKKVKMLLLSVTVMKKAVLLISALALSACLFAQEKMDPKMDMGKNEQKMDMKTDHVMMMGAKMQMMENGKTMPMEKDMTLNEGTKVTKNGMVIKKDGTTATMKEGDMMDMDGKMGKMPNMRKKGQKHKMKM